MKGKINQIKKKTTKEKKEEMPIKWKNVTRWIMEKRRD